MQEDNTARYRATVHERLFDMSSALDIPRSPCEAASAVHRTWQAPCLVMRARRDPEVAYIALQRTGTGRPGLLLEH